MGRRSLPEIKGDLDLSFHFLPMDDFPRPLTSETLFNEDVPLELEIGCGKGMFLRKEAVRVPEHRFLGIEIAYRYSLFSAAQLAKRGIRNARVLNADAAKMLHEFIPENSLTAVHLYFPDPWWKKAHRKRRIVRPDVVQRIEQCLVPGGLFHFWTDVEEYYLSGLKIIAENSRLEGPFPVEVPEARDDMDYHTHFERRTALHEKPVYRARFVKNA
ncbi:MAG: tRNA (guanosine(46)-N7)-methyltransferase TrmB [Thermoguttaceae bacterium]|nr:tRNA (guanosine(46)-N7)-methyltransferase TrmB [Thermoguttaceae bacterium]